MTSKQFAIKSTCIVVFFMSIFTGLNIIKNDFGLFQERNRVRIWTKEKTSKYLLSHKYIPRNYDGLIIGSSVAANIDPQNLKLGRIYNLSMEGANTYEAQMCTQKVINRGDIKLIIVSLYPYFTKDYGIKGAQIAPQEYWGSVFSMLPIHIAACRFREKFFKESKSRYYRSENGYIDINVNVDKHSFYKAMNEFKANPTAEIIVNEDAIKSLDDILDIAKDKNIKVVAYYHPLYIKKFQEYNANGTWDKYQFKLSSFCEKVDIVWDFNTLEYESFRSDITNYTGTGHLSSKGVHILEVSIRDTLNKYL